MVTAESIRELWYYRELFFFMVWRDIKIRYKQTVLGAAWAVIQPFVTMIVFTLIFGTLAGMKSDDLPHPVFYYCGMLPWTYFAGALRYSGNSLVENSNLIRKVYFPRSILPAATSLSGLVDFAIAFLILLVLIAYYTFSKKPTMAFSWELLLCPLLVFPLVVLAIGVGMFLAALNVRYRDVKHAIPFLIQIWFFGSAIIYPMSQVREKFGPTVARIMLYNPVTGIVEGFRAAVSPERTIDWLRLVPSMIVIVVVFAIGALYFHKAEREFADTI